SVLAVLRGDLEESVRSQRLGPVRQALVFGDFLKNRDRPRVLEVTQGRDRRVLDAAGVLLGDGDQVCKKVGITPGAASQSLNRGSSDGGRLSIADALAEDPDRRRVRRL